LRSAQPVSSATKLQEKPASQAGAVFVFQGVRFLGRKENGRGIELIPRPVRKNPPLQQMENASAARIIFSVSD
jgi:hypothetical protein